MNELVIECNNLSKIFLDGNAQIPILTDLNLEVNKGQQIAIMGRSGSGKTTLLQLLGGLDNPTNGTVKIKGIDLNNTSESLKTDLRNNQIGFIYQLHHLISEFTVLENVCLPLLINQQKFNLAKDLSAKLLAEIGLEHRLHFYPNQLSGGERQRVAVARALINNPGCILADEPTGNLDLESANKVMQLMQNLAKKHQTAIIMVTHDLSLAERFDKIYKLENGKLNCV